MICESLAVNKNKSIVVRNNLGYMEKSVSIRARSLSNYSAGKNKLSLSSAGKLDSGLNKMSI